MGKPVIIAISKLWISAIYKCYNLKLCRGRKCPDANTNKCMKCNYCKVEMSAFDATKLISSYMKSIVASHNLKEKEGG